MAPPLPPSERPGARFRSSQRISITVPHATLEALVQRSSREGRSLSNLAAFLIESSLQGQSSERPE